MAFPTKQDSVVTNPGGTGSSIVPTLSSHQAEDVIEIWVTKTGNAAWSAPAGWAIARQVTSPGSASTSAQGTLLYRRVLSTDTLPLSSPTCSLGATVTRHAVARTVRGADIEGVYTTPSWSAIGTGSGTANPIRPASVTTPAPEMMATHYYCQRLATNAPEPSGYTQDQEVITSGTLVTNVSQKNVADQATVLSNQDASPTSGGRWAAVITCAPSDDYPYYRSGSQATATATSVTPALPTGTTATDQRGNKDLIIATAEAAGTTPTPNTPGDWVEIGGPWTGTTSGGATSVSKWRALYDGSLDRQFNRSGSGEISVCFTTYYNVNQTTPIGNSDADPRASSTTSAFDAVARLAAKCLMQATSVADGAPSFTPPTGWIERMDGLGITCAEQTFNPTGNTASASFTLSAGSPTLTGLVEIVGLNDSLVTPSTLALADTQFAPSLAFFLNLSVQSLSITTFAPTIVVGGGGTTVTPDTVSLTTTTFAPQLNFRVTPGVSSLSSSSFAPQLSLKLTPNVSSLTLTTFAPTVTVSVQPTTLAQILTTFAPSLRTSLTPNALNPTTATFSPSLLLVVIPFTTALTTERFAPSAVQGTVVVPGIISLTTSVFAVKLSESLTPATSSLVLSSFAPALNTTVTPGTLSLASQTFAARLDLRVTPQISVLTIDTFAVSLGLALTPQTVGLSTATFASVVGVGVNVVPGSVALNLTAFPIRLSETLTPATTSLTLTETSPQLVTSVIPSTQTLALTPFAPQLHSTVSVSSLSLVTTTFAPTVSAGGQTTVIIPSTKSLFLNELAANVLAFHVRSELLVSRETQSTQVGKESRMVNTSRENRILNVS